MKTQTIKPQRTYNKGSINDAAGVAATKCIKTGRVIFVVPTYAGYAVTTKKPAINGSNFLIAEKQEDDSCIVWQAKNINDRPADTSIRITLS